MDLVLSPCCAQLRKLVDKAERSLVVCAPYFGMGPASYVVSHFRQRSFQPSLVLLTDLSTASCLSGATDVSAVAHLVRECPTAVLYFLPSLHAKVYIADASAAVVTSANFTDSGWSRNVEYGVYLDEPPTVRRIHEDVSAFAKLGSRVDVAEIARLDAAVADLRALHQRAQRSINGKLRRELVRRLGVHDEEVLRIRAAGRAPHTIFAEAVLYLLRRQPMTTEQIHAAVKDIHPDLCDDSLERVIDGKHFGKKWKHAVRTAQQQLKKRGLIVLTDGRWRIT